MGKPVTGQQSTAQKHATSMCSKPKTADSLLWQLSINNSVDAQNKRCSYGNGATLLVFKVLAYGQSRDNQHFSDGCVTKFSKVWGSARTVSVNRSSANTWVNVFFNFNLTFQHGYVLKEYWPLLKCLILNIPRKTFFAIFRRFQIIAYRRVSQGRLIFPWIFPKFSRTSWEDIQTILFLYFSSLNICCVNWVWAVLQLVVNQLLYCHEENIRCDMN